MSEDSGKNRKCLTGDRLALIVIKGDHVQVMPIKKSTNLGKLVDMIPDIVDKCKPCKEKGEEHKED